MFAKGIDSTTDDEAVVDPMLSCFGISAGFAVLLGTPTISSPELAPFFLHFWGPFVFH